MTDPWTITQAALLALLLLFLVVDLTNGVAMRRLGTYPRAATYPRVSVLVPARNEQANIGACVRSLLLQDYPDFEVVALDDHSTDDTLAILRALAAEFPRLTVMQGGPLPPFWLGKPWACQQLSQQAQGSLLLFTDADTVHRSDTLRHAVDAMAAENADLVTAVPREVVCTWGEQLIVPTISALGYALFPLQLAYWSRSALLSIANGQFMLLKRSAFHAVNGYEDIRAHVGDDVALGRRFNVHGLKWRLLNATRHIDCRMYRSFREAYDGFCKNLFAFFDYRLSVFLLAWSVIVCMAWEPILVVGQWLIHGAPSPAAMALAVTQIAVSLLILLLSFSRLRFPLYLIALYPLTVTLAYLMALRSLALTVTGKATWKGRALARPRVRWF